jgi:hypothetical protein
MRPAGQSIRAWCVAALAVACLQPAAAQSLRDPTIPPFGSGQAQGQGAGAAPTRGVHAPLSVILVDGKFHLVLGTRLYAEGQKIGEARIERITETEVWLREGSELRKVSNFVGVKRHKVVEQAETPVAGCGASAARQVPADGSPENPVPVADCDRGQP